MPRAVIYTRVSSERQVDNLSLDTQLKHCKNYCAQNGIQVAEIFEDRGESARTADRPHFQEMLTYCRERKKHIDFVVVYSVSRFARENYDHQTVRAYLSKLGVTLRSVTELFDDSSSGKFLENILAAAAQLDNDLRSERTAAGRRNI